LKQKKGIQNTKIKHNEENNKTPTKALELKLGVVGVVRTQCYHGGFRGGRSDDVLVSTVEMATITVRYGGGGWGGRRTFGGALNETLRNPNQSREREITHINPNQSKG